MIIEINSITIIVVAFIIVIGLPISIFLILKWNMPNKKSYSGLNQKIGPGGNNYGMDNYSKNIIKQKIKRFFKRFLENITFKWIWDKRTRENRKSQKRIKQMFKKIKN